MTESKLQGEIIQWLKGHGAYVVKPRAGPGVPTGCPDVLAFYKKRWLAIEVKSSAEAPYRTGQLATLGHLLGMNQFVFTAYPENWPGIKQALLRLFF